MPRKRRSFPQQSFNLVQTCGCPPLVAQVGSFKLMSEEGALQFAIGGGGTGRGPPAVLAGLRLRPGQRVGEPPDGAEGAAGEGETVLGYFWVWEDKV